MLFSILLIIYSLVLNIGWMFNLFRFLIVYLYLIYFKVYIVLVGAGRLPFDLHEAESELVVGYSTEFNSIVFIIFFLIEYTEYVIVIYIFHFSF
jgi:NADH:ubiquinone oxidoreductase subunit H